MISAIFLAAGQSKRLLKENKLLKIYKKKPLICHSLNSLIKSKVNKIIIVLGYESNKVRNAIIKNKKISFVVNNYYKKGMSSSIKIVFPVVGRPDVGIHLPCYNCIKAKIAKNSYNG